MELAIYANCEKLQRRVRDLQAEIDRLRCQLDDALRAGERQVCLFAFQSFREQEVL
jgi:uncharacterized small protein (DUF1192 family)